MLKFPFDWSENKTRRRYRHRQSKWGRSRTLADWVTLSRPVIRHRDDMPIMNASGLIGLLYGATLSHVGMTCLLRMPADLGEPALSARCALCLGVMP